MALSGLALVFQRFVILILFTLLRTTWRLIQNVAWRVNGTQRLMQECEQPGNYARSMHVLNVVTRYKFDIMAQVVTVDDFLYTHDRFENPDVILKNDHMTLMTLTEKMAIFCEVRPGCHVWKSDVGAFLKPAQFENCIRLLVIPRHAFHKLAEQIGDPKQVVFLFNTARCGSTLCNQIMESTGQCVTASEPCALNLVATLYRYGGDSETVRQLARHAVRYLCRPYSNFQPSVYFIKIAAPSAVALPLFRELFPTSQYLFMYRDPIYVGQSLYRVCQEAPFACITIWLSKVSGRFFQMCIDGMGFPGKDYNMRIPDDISMGLIIYTVTCKAYLDMRKSGFDVSALRYEDLIADPTGTCREILKFCGLPESLTDAAVRGMSKDSQRNSPISKEKASRHRNPELTERARIQANSLLSKYGLPLLGQPCVLDGTIACKY